MKREPLMAAVLAACRWARSRGAASVTVGEGPVPVGRQRIDDFLAELGVPERLVKRVADDGFCAYVFARGSRTVGICWKSTGAPCVLSGVEAVDMMGNPLPSPVRVGPSPVYLIGGNIEMSVTHH